MENCHKNLYIRDRSFQMGVSVDPPTSQTHSLFPCQRHAYHVKGKSMQNFLYQVLKLYG